MESSLYFYEKLPKRLSSSDELKLFNEMHNGSKEARDKLIVHNMRFVIYIVMRYFENNNYDKKDLVSIGEIGLEHAVDTFDASKNIKFSSYSTKCIYNELAGFLRNDRKKPIIDSLDRSINKKNYACGIINESHTTLKDMISDKTDFVAEFEEKEIMQIIYNIIEELPERDKQIIELLFGLNGNKAYTQNEIAKIIGVCQSRISRLSTRALKMLRDKLIEYNIILDNEKQNAGDTLQTVK